MKKGIIKQGDKKYPKLLEKIPDAPKQLFWRGNYEKNFFNNTLAVVGSRKMTNYGKCVVEELVGEIAMQGITIISGFMYGIDAAAHRSAIISGGKTIAVMPCGLDIIYPSYQKNLFSKIIENSLALSEYKKGSPAEKWVYPRRNRIVVGLSKAVLIVEAAPKSGSLITAELALKYKRKLFAVPGNIFSFVSKGTNTLIKNKLADPVIDVNDILKFFGKSKKERNQKKVLMLSKEEKEIYQLLEKDSLEIEEILEQTSISACQAGALLSLLEIKGVIKKEGLKYFLADFD